MTVNLAYVCIPLAILLIAHHVVLVARAVVTHTMNGKGGGIFTIAMIELIAGIVLMYVAGATL